MGPATGAGKGHAGSGTTGVAAIHASMGPATGAGKGPLQQERRRGVCEGFNGARHWGGKGTRKRCVRSLPVRSFNGARHWGGKGTPITVRVYPSRDLASMGPATGAGKGPTARPLVTMAEPALQWGPPLGRERDEPRGQGPSPAPCSFNGARHWGGKGTAPPRRRQARAGRLQWGPPLGRERDTFDARPDSTTGIGFNGARHWGGKGTRPVRSETLARVTASMGPATSGTDPKFIPGPGE